MHPFNCFDYKSKLLFPALFEPLHSFLTAAELEGLYMQITGKGRVNPHHGPTTHKPHPRQGNTRAPGINRVVGPSSAFSSQALLFSSANRQRCSKELNPDFLEYCLPLCKSLKDKCTGNKMMVMVYKTAGQGNRMVQIRFYNETLSVGPGSKSLSMTSHKLFMLSKLLEAITIAIL
jgi:hypothetical protein